MKRAMSVLLAIMMMTMCVFADAAFPAFMTTPVHNYTADYSFSLSFDNPEEVVALLDELEMPKEVSYFVDMKSLLKTLLTYDGKMNLQADISEDFNKINFALTSESGVLVDINPNLSIGVNEKMGIWMNMDLSDAEKPVFDIICSHPILNKYFKLTSEDIYAYAPEAMDMMKAVFNKEYFDSVMELSSEIAAKYVKIEGSGNDYTISIDNDSLISIIDESFRRVPEIMPFSEEELEDVEFPSLKGWKILGKDGIKTAVNLKRGQIESENMTADIEIDIPNIYTALTGEAWPLESKGTLDFTMKLNADIKDVGRTKVGRPVLTEDNSFTVADLMSEEGMYEEATPEDAMYPMWYVYGECSELPIVDGNIYVPLRMTLEYAYEDSAVIDYNDGVVTVTSEYFDGFDTLKLTIDTDKVYADDKEYTVGNIFTINGSTYVNSNMFKDVFGWELASAQRDYINNIYYYAFHTNAF